MINVGDYVSHIGFPPAEGVVVGIKKSNTAPVSSVLGVKLEEGRIMWGDAEEWVCLSTDYDDSVIDVDSVEIG